MRRSLFCFYIIFIFVGAFIQLFSIFSAQPFAAIVGLLGHKMFFVFVFFFFLLSITGK